MNLDNAIDAHAQWKIKLRTAIRTRQPLDADTIAKDNVCELGKWLHGEAKERYGATPAWAELLQLHATFHRAAAEVAKAISAGKYDEAERLLTAPAYVTASKQVTVAIMQLKVGLRAA
ncbi:MAG: CZB domain-containing protein [Myxococcota bacterium]